MELESNNIIHQIKKGNEQPLYDLYKQYRDEFVIWCALQFGATKEQAQDAFQDALLDFNDNIISGKLIELTSSAKTYIFQLGKFKVINILKKEKRLTYHDNLQMIKGKEFEEYMDDENRAFTQQQINNAINKLPEDCQDVLRLHYFKEYDMDSIAREMKYKNADTAKSKKSICMKKLLKELNNLKMFLIL